MYGVLYAISPELFPAKDRGTGNALTATATRIFGVLVRVPLSLLSPRSNTNILTGPDNRSICQPRNRRAGVHLRCVDHIRWVFGVGAAL